MQVGVLQVLVGASALLNGGTTSLWRSRCAVVLIHAVDDSARCTDASYTDASPLITGADPLTVSLLSGSLRGPEGDGAWARARAALSRAVGHLRCSVSRGFPPGSVSPCVEEEP